MGIVGSISVFMLFFLFSACSTETISVLDKPKERKLDQNPPKGSTTLSGAIENRELELADKLYLKYRGEFPDSSRLPTLMLKLSKAHMETGEYLLARYYAETYIKDYPDGVRVDQAWFLRAKSLFMRYTKDGSSQELADQFKAEVKMFMRNFPKSKFSNELKDMLKESQDLIKKRNEEIAKTYEKIGKLKAAEYYRSKNRS